MKTHTPPLNQYTHQHLKGECSPQSCGYTKIKRLWTRQQSLNHLQLHVKSQSTNLSHPQPNQQVTRQHSQEMALLLNCFRFPKERAEVRSECTADTTPSGEASLQRETPMSVSPPHSLQATSPFRNRHLPDRCCSPVLLSQSLAPRPILKKKLLLSFRVSGTNDPEGDPRRGRKEQLPVIAAMNCLPQTILSPQIKQRNSTISPWKDCAEHHAKPPQKKARKWRG